MREFLSGQTTHLRPSIGEQTVKLFADDDESLPSRAVFATAAGDSSVMVLQDRKAEAPGPGKVRIRQTAVAVNFQDILDRRGISPEFGLPDVLGLEGVGKIIDVGEKVSGFFPGDRVAYMSRRRGAYAEIRCIDADDCVSVPEGVSDTNAAALLRGVTAGLLLSRVFRPSPGETILIQSVSGGLGHLLCQWARNLELTVIGTVSSPDKAGFSRDCGCNYPVVMEAGMALEDEVMRITGGCGVDSWVHSNGVQGMDTAMASLSFCGHCAYIGNRDGESVSLGVKALRRRSLTFSAPVCFDYLKNPSALQRMAHLLFDRIQKRSIIPSIETFPMGRAADAHRRIKSRQTMGIVVLIPGE